MKYSLCSIAAAALLAFAPAAMAADSGGSNIAVINIQLIMRDSTAAKSVRDQLESKQKAFQSELSKKEEPLRKEEQELGKQKSVLSKDALDKKVNALRNKETEVQKEVESKKALLNSAFERALGDIQKSVTEIIVDMAKEKGFIIAIPTSQILYGDPKLDITDEVLKRLNQKLPKLDVKFDTSASDSPAKE